MIVLQDFRYVNISDSLYEELENIFSFNVGGETSKGNKTVIKKSPLTS